VPDVQRSRKKMKEKVHGEVEPSSNGSNYKDIDNVKEPFKYILC